MSDARLSSRRVYTGRVIHLDVDRVRFPDGSEGELEMIRHPGAAAVVPFLSNPEDDDPTLLLIRQYRYAADGYVYEIPAGRLDSGEEPLACAHRELLEETGCRAAAMTRLTTIYTTPGFTDERIHLFMAADLTYHGASREPDEFMEVVRLPLSEALDLVKGEKITDAKSIVALLWVAGFTLGR